MKTYSVKEAYVTLQGEGAQTGRWLQSLEWTGARPDERGLPVLRY